MGAVRRGPMGLLLRREAAALARFERICAERFDHTLLVSSDEVACFAAMAGPLASRVTPLSNGVDTEYFAPDASRRSPFADARPRIVFTGAMDYAPNVDAVTWLVQDVLQLIDPHQRPDLAIVGSRPTRAVRLLEGPQVQVTGRVDDVRPYLQHAQAVVAADAHRARHSEQGAGGHGDGATGAGRRKPRSTGWRRSPDGDVLLAPTTPKTLAARIAELAAGEHQELGPAARRHVVTRYGWTQRLSLLDQMLTSAPG